MDATREWYEPDRRARTAFWLSTPAILFPIVVIYFFWAGMRSITSGQLGEQYRFAARVAFEGQDLDTADLYFRKLIHLDEKDDSARFGLALTASRQGNQQRARQLMSRIAPLDCPGHIPAHFWLARDMAADSLTTGSGVATDRLKTIQQHLLYVVRSQPHNLDAHALLGRVCLPTGQYSLAAEHLAEAVSEHPDLRLPLAKLYMVLGRKESASQQAETAKQYYAARVAEKSGGAEAPFQLAAVHLFLEEFELAEQLLENGLAQFDDDRFRFLLVSLRVIQFDRTPKNQLPRRLELLQDALNHQPDNIDALKRLAAIAGEDAGTSATAQGIVENLLTQEGVPAANHFILGTMAAKSGDHAKAIDHLRQAHEANPAMDNAANNLAWCLAYGDPPRLDEALQLIEAVLKAAPGDPEFRDTRGQILLKLGRWQEAITDFEAVLRVFPDNLAIHQRLATAYEHLGMSEIAEKHRAFAGH